MSSDSPHERRPRPDIYVLAAGMLVVATVWGLSCWWSFTEQTRAADSLHFRHPAVLPWMLDALAVALALVALASALNGQSAGSARLGVLLALAGSVWANTQGVSLRFDGHPKQDALIMAAIAPLSAFIALEVILGRVRRLVLWLRGEKPPAAVPALRLVRLLLAPTTSFGEWRTAVLARTAPDKPAVSLAPDADAATGQGERHAPTLPAPSDPGTTHRPSGVVPADADRGDEPSQASPVGPGPDAVTTPLVVVSAGQGSSGPAAAPPARTMDHDPLTHDPVDHQTMTHDPANGSPDHADQTTGHRTTDRVMGHGSVGQRGHRDPVDPAGVADPADRAQAIVDHGLLALTVPELARRFGVSETTAKRDRKAARALASPLRAVR